METRKISKAERRKVVESSFEDFQKNVGKKVQKISERPFKSGLLIATVKDIVNHPITKKPAYIFLEDDSQVECFRCIAI